MENIEKKIFFKNRERKQVLVEACPLYFSIIISAVFCVLAGIVAIVVSAWPMNKIAIEENLREYNGSSTLGFFNNMERVSAEVAHYVSMNEFISFNLQVKKKAEYINVGIDHIQIPAIITLEGKENGKTVKLVENFDKGYEIKCMPGKLDCEYTQLWYIEMLKYDDYRITISLREKIGYKNLLEDHLKFSFVTVGSGWIVVELVFYFLCWVFFIALMLFFIGYNYFFQSLSKFRVEQYLLIICDLFLVLYVDPFCLVDDVTDSSVFTFVVKFVDSVYISLFVSFLFFSLRMFVFFIEESPKKRKWHFYVLQLAGSVIIFIMVMIITFSYRLQRKIDTFSLTLIIILLVVSCVLFPLHFFRFFVLMRKRILKTFILKRIILLMTLVIVSLCASIAIFSIKNSDDQLNKHGYSCIFYLIVIFLNISYLPSFYPHTYDDDSDNSNSINTEKAPLFPKGENNQVDANVDTSSLSKPTFTQISSPQVTNPQDTKQNNL